MENVAFCHSKQVLKIKRSQNIHVMYVQRFLQVFVHLSQEGLLDQRMRNRSDLLRIVGSVRRVLHETIHYMVSGGTKCVIVHAGDGQVHKGSHTDTVVHGLLESRLQKLNRMTVNMHSTCQKLLRFHLNSSKSLEFRKFFQSQIDFSRSSVILNIFQFVVHASLQVILCIFDQMEESNSISAIAQNDFTLYYLSILQLHSDWSVLISVQYFIHWTTETYLCTI